VAQFQRLQLHAQRPGGPPPLCADRRRRPPRGRPPV
jgi:hypothetical protein